MFVLGGRLTQYFASIACQLSVISAGAAFNFLEPYTLKLTRGEVEGIVLSPEAVSWLVAIVDVGCILSSVVSGYLADKYGRKLVILSTGLLGLVSCLLLLVSTSLPVFFLVRILQGMALGIAFSVAPIYTAEIAEPKVRGRLSGIFQVAMYVGFLYTFAVGSYLYFKDYVFASVLPPFLFVVAFTFFHETPYFLLMAGRAEEAERALLTFRGRSDVSGELDAMRNAVAEEMKAESSWSVLFCDPIERRAFIILQIVNATKYLSGLSTIVTYASETFSIANTFLSPEEQTIILGCFLCGTCVASSFLSDFFGRRRLLLVSCFGMFVSHLLTGTYFYLEEMTFVNAHPFVCLMYIGLAGYCIFSSIGISPLLQTLQTEMFTSKTRGFVGGFSGVIGSVYCFASIKAYRPINDYFGVYLNFWLFSGVCLIGGILLTLFKFETNGKIIGRMNSDRTIYKTRL